MYCEKCGFQSDDKMLFCQNCGNPLRKPAGGPGMNPAGGPARTVAGGPARIVAGGPARSTMGVGAGTGGMLEALRRLILSPLYLVAVIALTAQVVLNVIVATQGYSRYAALIYSLLDAMDVPYYYSSDLNEILSTMNKSSGISAVFANLPVIVIAAGLWILYANARNSMRRMETTGLTMAHVVVIIQMILYGLGLAGGVIVSLIACVAIGELGDMNPAGLIVLLLLIFAALGFLVFFYYTRILRMITSAKDIIMTGNKTYPASMFVIVLTFIAGGFQCISSLGAIAGGFMNFLSQAAVATASIAFGLLMLKFNTLEMQAQGAPAVAGRIQPAPGAMNVPPRTPAAGPGMQPAQGAMNVPPRAPAAGTGTQPAQGAFNVPPRTPSGDDPFKSLGNAPKYPSFQPGAQPVRPASSPAQPVPSPMIIPPKPETIVMGYNAEEEKKRRYANEGTMVLAEDPQMPPARLVRVNDGAEIKITKTNFTIGKAYGSVDFFIENNPAISRKHAEIVYNEGRFYIIDTKSTNHVCVDGKQIPPETPVPLSSGAKIRLADEIFEFRQG